MIYCLNFVRHFTSRRARVGVVERIIKWYNNNNNNWRSVYIEYILYVYIRVHIWVPNNKLIKLLNVYIVRMISIKWFNKEVSRECVLSSDGLAAYDDIYYYYRAYIYIAFAGRRQWLTRSRRIILLWKTFQDNTLHCVLLHRDAPAHNCSKRITAVRGDDDDDDDGKLTHGTFISNDTWCPKQRLVET